MQKEGTHPRGITAPNLLFQQTQLVFLDLQLTHARPPRVPPRPRSRLLALERFESLPRLRHALFDRAEFLRTHEHARPARRGTTRHSPARLVNVPVDRDAAHAYVPRVRHCLCGLCVVADQRVVEDERDRFGDFVWVSDERERRSYLAWREVVCILQFLV